MKKPRYIRVTASLLLATYLNVIVPVAPLFAASTSAPGEPLVRTRQGVRANRSVIKGQPPASVPRFSSAPTTAEIFAARVLAEPFVPLTPGVPAAESAALADAIGRYAELGGASVTPFTEFLGRFPNSAWAPSVRLNLGLRWFAEGGFSKAISAYEASWSQAKSSSDAKGRMVADRSVAELLRMHARLGRVEILEELLAEIADRQFTGTATELVAGAREGLALMKNRPEAAYRCGPAALDRLVAFRDKSVGFDPALLDAKSTSQGVNLADVWRLSERVHLGLQMARREKGAEILSPSVVHWKLGHYAALFAEGGLYRLEDPTFGAKMRASRETLDEEASGYFLVRAGPLPGGWTPVTEAEGSRVWGKGNTGGEDNKRTTPEDLKANECPPSGGMAVANMHLMVVSLNLTDTPVGYAPPVGPAIFFTATYNQREASQPTTPDYSNLGTKWVHNWLSFIDEGVIPTSNPPVLNATARLPGGGSEHYTTASMTVSPLTHPYDFLPQPTSRSKLQKLNATTFVITKPDGSQMTYGRQTGVSGAYRYFLTELTDSVGQTATLAYDSQNRLLAITDAIGQVTTFSYALTADPLKITKVEDPFGRFAEFDYDSSERLEKITDVIGLESEFAYAGSGDFVESLTTPYGTSTFAFGQSGLDRWLETTDPLGNKERVETRGDWADLPGAGPLPSGMNALSTFQNFRNTLHWDKKAMRETNGSVHAAHIYHWLHTALNETSGTPENEKRPLENRVFYNYEGQTSSVFEGTSSRPSAIGRVLDDGTSQITHYEYNSFGRVTKTTDPLGRITSFIYDSNEIDLLAVRQKTGPATNDYEVIVQTTYNAEHQPLTTTDAAGQVTTFTYNSAGQISTLTNAKSETSSFFYDPDGDPAGSRLGGGDRDPAAIGYLVAIDGPLAGTADTVTFEWDGYGRVRTATDAEGYAVTTDFDDFDRPTVVTYPDSTFAQVAYSRLDAVKVRDRRGRWSQAQYNALRQRVTSTDARGLVTQFVWCKCGSLAVLVDPAGNKTAWSYDLQGRLTSKEYADGKLVRYAYENTTSRLQAVTDPIGQVTNYQYLLDNTLDEVSYTNAVVATSPVSYTYETYYPRVETRVDGVGTTAYNYNPITSTPTLGAGRLAEIDGPWANDTIAYTYDELGRVLTRGIDSTANPTSIVYDELGRTGSVTNLLGTFDYAYVDATGRVEQIDYPNGQRTNYSYYGGTADRRLQQIENVKPNASNLSKFGYTYDANGIIQTWSRQIDAASALTSSFRYDPADQLTEASVATGPSTTKQYFYRYDKSGNRTSEQIDAGVLAATTNVVNQVTALSATGPIRFEGSLNEPGTVTIAGTPAVVAADNTFKADVPLAPGTPTVTVTATDGSSNTSNQSYEVTVSSGTARTLTHDLNGNMLTDGTGRTYGWDAVDRLVTISQGTDVTTFVYDGAGRRVQEKFNGTEVKRWVWCDGPQPCEERDNTNAVTKRFYPQGQVDGSTKLFYTFDHLGSIREMVDDTGAIRARYDYDPYGRRTKQSGDLDADFGFTGHYFHSASSLHLTLYRAYDAELGRWLSRDPIAEQGGVNLYSYVGNNPINAVDPIGLADCPPNQRQPWNEGNWEISAAEKTPWQEIKEAFSSPEEFVKFLESSLTTGGVGIGGMSSAGMAVKNVVTAIVAKNGTKITGLTGHGVDRVIGDGAKRAGTTPQAILDAFKNPKKIVSGVDNQGRPFEIFSGKNARVVVNPQTGKIVSTNPLSGAGAH